jgi:hypothetical protein
MRYLGPEQMNWIVTIAVFCVFGALTIMVYKRPPKI